MYFDSLDMTLDNGGFWVLGNGICLKLRGFKVLFGTPEKKLTMEPVPEFLSDFLCTFLTKEHIEPNTSTRGFI